MTLVPLALVLLLLAVGAKKKEARTTTNLMALAITYIVLPTVSIVVFGVFPCDDFDDDTSFLRADYSLSCKAPVHKFYFIFGYIMMAVYPLGVPLWYVSSELFKKNNKNKIKCRSESCCYRSRS